MAVVGGVFGYVLMLNGTLAQSAVWVCAWTAAGSWLAGLLAPDRTLRYSLFLAVFTFNGVILCQCVWACRGGASRLLACAWSCPAAAQPPPSTPALASPRPSWLAGTSAAAPRLETLRFLPAR